MHEVVTQDFPDLRRSGNYERRSPWCERYNCIAFAAGDEGHWWWPGYGLRDWWPTELRRDGTVEAFEEMFELLGYLRSATTDAEPGYSKAVLYENKDGPSHAARQEIDTERWLSKLGRAHDIVHHTAEDLEGPSYGEIIRVFRRPVDVALVIEVRLRYAIGGKTEMARLSA